MRFAVTISVSRSRPKKSRAVEIRCLRTKRDRGTETAPLVERRSRRGLRRTRAPGCAHHAARGVLAGASSNTSTSRCAPKFARQPIRARVDGPRPVAEPVGAPDAAQKHAQAPVVDAVSEEEDMAAAQLRRQRHRYDRPGLGVQEVVDVIVLADDEALVQPARARVDTTVRAQEDASAPRATGPCRRSAPRSPSPRRPERLCEAASIRTGREVADDVELLRCVGERALDRRVEPGR